MEAKPHAFQGRTLAVVNDFSLREQWFLYQKTRELKEAVKRGADLTRFRLHKPEAAVYTIFMEDSTRTKESFRNAAEFHGLKVNMFDAKTSSFQKNETITDTIKMLVGYSTGQSLFVIRSKVEGVCRWLEEAIADYTQTRGYPRASFINAGDGRHEHPSQEFLDELSFLEQKGWDADRIHLVLLGDLFHGRTVHSKVDGLRIYGEVEVDLVAPPELALPKMYEDKMLSLGYNVRKFSSIAEYLQQPKVAKLWYFTRLQLERMGDKVLDKSADLRKAVTFQREFVDKLPPNTKFFHPLPRDSRHPVLPFWVDHTDLNGWDQQSQNGYFVRIVLLGLLGGISTPGFEFEPEPRVLSRKMSDAEPVPGPPTSPFRQAAKEFITEMPVVDKETELESRCGEVGLAPLHSGVVMDKLAEGRNVEQIWALMGMVRSVLGLECMGGMGVYKNQMDPSKAAGFLALPEYDISTLERLPLKKLAAMAPGSTLAVIQDGYVKRRYMLEVPPMIYNFHDVSCKNLACISNPGNGQREVTAFFYRCDKTDSTPEGSWAFACKYCDAVHSFWQIWDYRYYQSYQTLTEFTGF